MISSMTGFGRSEASDGAFRICVEIKSVNHRYLEIGIKMPKILNACEPRIRGMVKQYVQRGKIDIFISCGGQQMEGSKLRYNRELAAEYMQIFSEMEEQFRIKNDVGISSLSKCPEVITIDEDTADDEALWEVVEPELQKALERFVKSRQLEGQNLADDIAEKLKNMQQIVSCIEQRSPQLQQEYQSRLREKVAELLADAAIDEGRIAAEVVIYADKVCVDEETVRLKSHISQAAECLSQPGGVGRRLDFIAQEMNREANTILSKANDLFVSDQAIELKTEIEKVREQIQNIE